MGWFWVLLLIIALVAFSAAAGSMLGALLDRWLGPPA